LHPGYPQLPNHIPCCRQPPAAATREPRVSHWLRASHNLLERLFSRAGNAPRENRSPIRGGVLNPGNNLNQMQSITNPAGQILVAASDLILPGFLQIAYPVAHRGVPPKPGPHQGAEQRRRFLSEQIKSLHRTWPMAPMRTAGPGPIGPRRRGARWAITLQLLSHLGRLHSAWPCPAKQRFAHELEAEGGASPICRGWPHISTDEQAHAPLLIEIGAGFSPARGNLSAEPLRERPPPAASPGCA